MIQAVFTTLGVISVLAGGAFKADRVEIPVGSGEFVLPVRVDHSEPLQGFFWALRFDPARVNVSEVSLEGSEAAAAEWERSEVDESCGSVQLHLIMDWTPPYDDPRIPPGSDQVMAFVRGRVIAPEEPATYDFRFDTSCVRREQPIVYVVDGLDVVPDLEDGAVTVVPVPVITEIVPGESPGGEIITVKGRDFPPDPEVSVDGEPVPASDVTFISSRELRVLLPPCRAGGERTLRVCRGDFCGQGFFRCIWETRFVRGDANNEPPVNVADVISILGYLFTGGPLFCLDAGDVNDDGKVDISDPIYLLRYLFALGTPPPAPFPDPGTDPTEDAVLCLD